MAAISSTWLDEAFRTAKHDFISGLKNPSVYDFSKFQTIDDVYDEAERIQKEQAKTKTLRALKKIEPFIVGINNYSSTIDTFVQAKAEILALLWMTSSLVTVFEKLVKVLADIGLALPQFKKYTELFEGNDQIKQAMCLFYIDILDFYKILLNFLGNRRFNTFFEALWPNVRSKIDVVQTNIERHKLLMTSQVTLEDVAQSYEARKQAMHEYEEQQKFRDRQDFEALASEYSPSTYHRKLAQILDITAPGSGGWLAQKPEFIQWSDKNNVVNRCLWLYGIPGSGKTFLSAGSIRRLQKSQNPVLFVFLTHDDQASGGVIELMHSLIFQAAKNNLNLMPLVYGYVKSDQQTMPNSNRFESDRDFVKGLLIEVLDNCTQAFIVVDGLDELEVTPRRLLLEALLQIIEESKTTRLLISSREERDIVKRLEGRAIFLRADHNNAEDIQLYADSELKNWLDELKDSGANNEMLAIANKSAARIVKASGGMILYTKIVLEVVRDQGTPGDIELQLESLPHGLDQAYARLLHRIREQISPALRTIVKKVLHWILCAKIPLREQQILQALVIESGAQDFTKGEREFRDIRKDCGPIIESGKEIPVLPIIANIEAAIACSTYLRFTSLDALFDVHSASYETVLDQRILRGYLVFFEYAAVEWLGHVKACLPTGDLKGLTDILSDLFATRNIITTPMPAGSSSISGAFEVFRDCPYVQECLINADRLSGKAQFGLFEDHATDPSLSTKLSDNGELQDMLIDAATQDNIEGIKALILSCVSTDQLFREKWHGHTIYFHQAFLGHAAWKGSGTTLRHVLDLKIEPLLAMDCLGMALAVAIEFKRLEAIKLLLSYGADVYEPWCINEIIPSHVLKMYREGDPGNASFSYTGYERALSLWDPDLMNYLVDICGVKVKTEMSGKFCLSPAVLNLGPQEIRDRLSDIGKYIVGPEVFDKGIYEAVSSYSVKALDLCLQNGANSKYLRAGESRMLLDILLEEPAYSTPSNYSNKPKILREHQYRKFLNRRRVRESWGIL
ncbi:hypothetical protein O1611_g3888 [Lasiodiplodia mahajangana]|uniref:Uncharacterized protein n=1 Tax=Lasiodiplodia mahajangana TaxID=1108764 RepID=A0ACC2JQW7_9PEZI|nr:hypothetical protein O1611_g3888 [Lasiodiplodia mahajangana]